MFNSNDKDVITMKALPRKFSVRFFNDNGTLQNYYNKFI